MPKKTAAPTATGRRLPLSKKVQRKITELEATLKKHTATLRDAVKQLKKLRKKIGRA